MIPRIRGRVGQDENNQWCFEISVWHLDGEKQVGEPMTFGPWDSEKIAHEEMNRSVRIASEAAEKSMGCEPSGKYIDMKNGGILRPWESN